MHNPCATFTTRGCIRKCPFCVVPKVEGDFRELDTWKPAPLICDNNICAASKAHFARVIDRVKHFPYIDFNQGMDARLIKDWHFEEMQRLNGVRIRFAFDHISHEQSITDAIEKAREKGFKDFGIYVLIGYKDTPEDALYRLEKVREWDIWPNPMRYQPVGAENKNEYISPLWTDRALKRTMRYYSRLQWLKHIPFSEYQHSGDETPDMFTGVGA